jgi:hypothetical protein
MTTLFGGATPAGSSFTDGSPGIHVCTTFTFHNSGVGVAGQVTEIWFYVGGNNSGTWTVVGWEVTAADPSGAGTLVANQAYSGTPPQDSWSKVTLSSPVSIPADYNRRWRFGVHNGQNYWVNNNFFNVHDETNAPITAYRDNDTTSTIGRIDQGTFAISSSVTAYPASTGSKANYGIDVTFVASASTITKDTVESYRVFNSVTKNTTESYRVLNSVTKNQAESYRVLNSVTKDTTETYRVLNSVTKNQAESYRVLNALTKDTVESYRVLNAVTKDTSESYRILNALTKDTAESYRIFNVGTKDVVELYNVLGGTAQQKDVVESYRILNAVTKNQTELYRIYNAVTKNIVESYRIFNAGTVTVSVWSSDLTEIPATVEGLWNGTTVVPCTLEVV